ncbi:ExeA family protein [Vibrio sp. B1Z05]|uniref:ExeA family protein n=1 Tax=Vibrio sp. B1Z05 TaxID=2654980 RepID=UPI00128C05AF|nr:ExeA family protein [Vibrio sp. B1Z05]MPW38015.1 AAA family ATPase [Vibrio sp. B1Z05]
MYKDFFGFVEEPFSIVPSSKYLFLSARHREALSHLQIGLNSGGGFAMLTGEVGTGKTTVSKAMLANLEGNWVAGLILNPTFSEVELLEAICDEFSLSYTQPSSLKQLSQAIYHYLLDNHKKGIQTLLLIDEAQHLSAQVLEQLRLLTNLETDSRKLLKVLLVGQPELQHKLQTIELRQLAQRITGRYHLLPLVEKDIADYIGFRLRVAGGCEDIFSDRAVQFIASQSQGIPRLINLICDKALYYAMLSQQNSVDRNIAKKACHDVLAYQAPTGNKAQVSTHSSRSHHWLSPALLSLAIAGATYLGLTSWHQWQQLQTQFNEQQAHTQQLQQQMAEKQSIANQEQQHFAQLIEQSRSPMGAMQALYHLWGFDASIVDSDCEYGTTPPFHCFQSKASLSSIVASNRPVVITLYDDQHPYFAILQGVANDRVTLLLAGERVQLPVTWLDQHWKGQFRYLWYSEILETVKANSSGQQVQILDKLLAKALNATPLETSIFNDELKKRVSTFQAWQGLDADGIAGNQTLRQLDRLTSDNAPKLLSATAQLSAPSTSSVQADSEENQ